MNAPLTQATATAVREALAATYGMTFGTKGGPFWAGAALVFDVARLFGVRWPTGARLVGEFVTTLGTNVYYPPGLTLAPQALVETDTHETRHGHQFVAEPGVMPFEYLRNSRRRAEYESAAFGDAIAVRWALTGEIPASINDLPHGVLLEYGCTPADLQMVQDQLEAVVTSISHGVIPEGPARITIATIARVQPDALDPRAVALIRANSPGVLS